MSPAVARPAAPVDDVPAVACARRVTSAKSIVPPAPVTRMVPPCPSPPIEGGVDRKYPLPDASSVMLPIVYVPALSASNVIAPPMALPERVASALALAVASTARLPKRMSPPSELMVTVPPTASGATNVPLPRALIVICPATLMKPDAVEVMASPKALTPIEPPSVPVPALSVRLPSAVMEASSPANSVTELSAFNVASAENCVAAPELTVIPSVADPLSCDENVPAPMLIPAAPVAVLLGAAETIPFSTS